MACDPLSTLQQYELNLDDTNQHFIFLGATAPIWALAYLHETLRFTSTFNSVNVH
jgi:hypothetical protein